MEERSPYHEGMRQLQDARETRALADRLSERTARTAFNDEDRAFIHRCPMFFIATADDLGHPDCSYKGGAPGFVRVIDDQTLVFPDYDGNGMYRTLGNTLVNPHVGLLFIDFENPRRLRVNGISSLSFDDPLLSEFPGAVMIVRVVATRIFPNCPRYIHKMAMLEPSVYTPQAGAVAPIPDWKKRDYYREVLPPRDRMPEEEG
jgi:predicted pyridoxine 5'-phosphate oxidase superfamily flavin-nucleotide-binding protein